MRALSGGVCFEQLWRCGKEGGGGLLRFCGNLVLFSLFLPMQWWELSLLTSLGKWFLLSYFICFTFGYDFFGSSYQGAVKALLVNFVFRYSQCKSFGGEQLPSPSAVEHYQGAKPYKTMSEQEQCAAASFCLSATHGGHTESVF